MRVVVNTVEEFIQNLDVADKLFQNAIRISTIHKPYGGADRFTAVKFEVIIQISAIVVSDGVDFLLDFGEICGFDYTDADPSNEGSERADKIRSEITDYSKTRGWKILPGMIGD